MLLVPQQLVSPEREQAEGGTACLEDGVGVGDGRTDGQDCDNIQKSSHFWHIWLLNGLCACVKYKISSLQMNSLWQFTLVTILRLLAPRASAIRRQQVQRPCLQSVENKKTRFCLAALWVFLFFCYSIRYCCGYFAGGRVVLRTSGWHDFRPDLRAGLRGWTAGLKLARL